MYKWLEIYYRCKWCRKYYILYIINVKTLYINDEKIIIIVVNDDKIIIVVVDDEKKFI